MSLFYIDLDLAPLISIDEHLKPAADRAMKAAARALTMATHAHIVEQVQAKLHSSRQKYLDNLSFQQAEGDESWSVKLDRPAFFIEEGIPNNHEMIDDLLHKGYKSKAKGQIKTAKDGSRYRSIPFEHMKGPAQQTKAQRSLTETVQAEMKRLKIPYKKLEKDTMGQPKIGTLHRLDIQNRPPSLGGGAVPVGRSGASMLQGLQITQKRTQDKAGNGVGSANKSITTFRTVSSKQKGTGAWVHPGLEGRKFIDEAYDWALREWQNKIGPDIVAQLAHEL